MLKKDKRTSVTILTRCGYITYNRYVMSPLDETSKKNLYAMGLKQVVPMDEYLGLANLPFKITPGMALYLAKKCITARSYKAVEEEMQEEHNITVSDDTLRKVTDHIGNIVYQRDKSNSVDFMSSYSPDNIKAAHRVGRPRKNPFIIYVETDGAMYLAREEGSITQGWHENKLGLVFTSEDLEEKTDREGNSTWSIVNCEYISTLAGVDELREMLVTAAIKHGLKEADYVIILGDGAEWIKGTREKYLPFATQILDLYHLKEKVGKFAEQEFGATNPYSAIWAKRVCNLLEAGKWREVLTIKRVAKYSPEEGKKPRDGINLYTYIKNNCDMIDYPTYRELGYFVGSGAIESGNKNVVQVRIKGSGMRWLPSKARGVISLRCKLLSGLWDHEVVPLVTRLYYVQRKPIPWTG